MTPTLTLSDPREAHDVVSFLGRARRVLDGNCRVVADGQYAQFYVGILMPRGLLDKTPTVLGLRVAHQAGGGQVDVIVPIESLVHRIDAALVNSTGDRVAVDLPHPAPSLHWPALTPPRDSWKKRRSIGSAQLADVAQKGIGAIAEAIPETVGESVLQRVRAEVWGRPMAHRDAIPWAAGFAADALGLLDHKSLAVHSCGTWVRLSSTHGYILIKGQGEPTGLGEPDDDA